MITPRLYRRSLANAAQWRLLFLFWAALLVPAFIAALPVQQFLGAMLNHSPRAKDVVAWMDGSTLLELARALGSDGHAELIRGGIVSGLFVVVLVAPLVAGATVAATRSDEPLSLQRLLAGGGEWYGRMLRTFIAGLIVIAIAFGLGAFAMKAADKANERAIWEAAADKRALLATIAAGVLVFLFHLIVDTTRAQLAADPTRRSAFFALGAAIKLFFRMPLRVLGIGLVGWIAAAVPALLFLALRLRITQSGGVGMLLAWLLAQGAVLAVGWGRATRLFGLAELVRADMLDRPKKQAFVMEPPVTTPPAPAPVVESTALSALSASPEDLSRKDGSAS